MRIDLTFYYDEFRAEISYDTENFDGRIMYFFMSEKVEIPSPVGKCIVFIYPYDWNLYMTPWKEVGVMGNETGGLKDFLPAVLKDFLPDFEKRFSADIQRGIGGYSLGGLAALYTAVNYDMFSYVASVSGSLWYPGALEYFSKKVPEIPVNKAFFSVGNKENAGKSIRKCVIENTVAIKEAFSRHIPCEYVLNEGGHFTDIPGRITAAIDAF